MKNKNNKKYVINKKMEKDQDKYFKVNLPSDKTSFKSGNGEGVWAHALNMVDYQKYKDNKSNEIIKVRILNNSFYYPDLTYGSIINVELRGDSRPIWIDYDN